MKLIKRMIINKKIKVLVKLEQLRCLNKIKEAIALLPLCCVAPLTGISIPVGGHALPKNKISKRVVQLIRLAECLSIREAPSMGERQPELGWANQIPYGIINFFVV